LSGKFEGKTLYAYHDKEVFLWDEMALNESPVTCERTVSAKVGISGVFADEKAAVIKVTHKKQMAFNEEMIRFKVQYNNQEISVDLERMKVYFFI
jgi:hypothetical protein